MLFLVQIAPIDTKWASDAVVTDTIDLHISIDGEPIKPPIRLGLFGEDVPRTVYNFIEIAAGTRKSTLGPRMTYDHTPIHRIVDNMVI